MIECLKLGKSTRGKDEGPSLSAVPPPLVSVGMSMQVYGPVVGTVSVQTNTSCM